MEKLLFIKYGFHTVFADGVDGADGCYCYSMALTLKTIQFNSFLTFIIKYTFHSGTSQKEYK